MKIEIIGAIIGAGILLTGCNTNTENSTSSEISSSTTETSVTTLTTSTSSETTSSETTSAETTSDETTSINTTSAETILIIEDTETAFTFETAQTMEFTITESTENISEADY